METIDEPPTTVDFRHFPKGTALSQITQATCDAVATQMNNRPRKVLGFNTPLKSFTELLALTA